MTSYSDLSPITAEDKFMNISNRERIDLSEVAYIAIDRAIKDADKIKRIADHLSNRDFSQAFEDVIEKGIRELIALCDMDDAMEKENTEVKE